MMCPLDLSYHETHVLRKLKSIERCVFIRLLKKTDLNIIVMLVISFQRLQQRQRTFFVFVFPKGSIVVHQCEYSDFLVSLELVIDLLNQILFKVACS